MSPTPANLTSVDLPLSQVNGDLTRCPKCQGTHVILEGDFLRHFQEEFQDGESVQIQLAHRCKLASRIICQSCEIAFQLMSDEIFNEHHDSMRIRIELAKRDGLLQQLDETQTVRIQ